MNFTLEQAKKFYPTAVGDFKLFLEQNFPDLVLSELPCLIKTKWAFEKLGRSFSKFMNFYEKRLQMLKDAQGENYLNDIEYQIEVLALNRATVLRALEIVVEAKNEGWFPNWEDEDERKWYPWFFLDSPFRFCDAGYQDACTYAGCASRLHLQNEADAKEVGTEYLDLWEFYMTK